MKSTGIDPHPQPVCDVTTAEHWFPDNLDLINARLAAIPARNIRRPVAIFDFDNTCVFRDVGQAVFFHQLTGLRYRLTPEQLAALLPTTLVDLDGKPMALITSTLLSTYQRLWPLISTGKEAQARQLPDCALFTNLLLWFVDKARRDERLGPRYVLPLMGKLLAGYTLAELRLLATEVVTAAMQEPLVSKTLAFDAPEPLGHLQSSHSLGLHAHREMQGLMHSLQNQGIDCFVVSASTEWLVEEAARLLDFPVTPERIFGIRVSLDHQGVLTTGTPADYPVTFREGKAEIITQQISGTPVLVAGDADTDYEMLTLPDIDIRLLINRNQAGLISTLYQDPRVLLQGLDLRCGRFRPFRESIAA